VVLQIENTYIFPIELSENIYINYLKPGTKAPGES